MIAVVTDSTAQVPPDLRDRLGIRVVPAVVTIDGQVFLDGAIDASDALARLHNGADVTTSTPSPGEFLAAYEELAAAGVTGVVSVHIAGFASATLDTARLAARSSPVPVEVVDSRSASFGTGLCAWAAGETGTAGGDLAAVAAAARQAAADQHSVFVMDLMAALRSGRFTATSVDLDAEGVPVMALRGEDIVEVGRVATIRDAARAMASYVEDRAQGRRLRVGIGEMHAPEVVDALATLLKEADVVEELVRYEVAASVAVHTGTESAGAFFAPIPT